MSPNPPAGAELRAAAARLVVRVLDERIAAEDALAAAPAVDKRDQSLLAALLYGALRWHHRLEWQTTQLLTRPLKAQQSDLAALLRLGLLQLQELRIPAHAAVSATVDAAALLGHRGAAALINAVLRRFQREHERLALEMLQVPVARFSHPAWLLEAVRDDWPEAWAGILEANNSPAPMWLRVNLRRTSRADFLARLAAAGIAATPDAEVATGVRLAEPRAVESLPGFASGEASVQDIAAQRAAALLDLRAGQRVLDACAAPGGKTCHILEARADLAEVWAVDRDSARLRMVADNLRRLELAAKLVVGDAAAPAEWWDGRPFERILLDAPCSAVGVIRRHPDIKVLRRPEDVARVVQLQQRLLRALWPLLAPGGRLLYATCTVLKRENDGQMAAFRLAEPAIEGTVGRQWLPGEAQGDGFYYASLLKPLALRTPSVPSPQP